MIETAVVKALIFALEVEYTPEEKQRFKSDPNSCHLHRREVEEAMNEYMSESGFTYGTPRQQEIQCTFKNHMSDMLKQKPTILNSILPAYPPGCRRCKVICIPGSGCTH